MKGRQHESPSLHRASDKYHCVYSGGSQDVTKDMGREIKQCLRATADLDGLYCCHSARCTKSVKNCICPPLSLSVMMLSFGIQHLPSLSWVKMSAARPRPAAAASRALGCSYPHRQLCSVYHAQTGQTKLTARRRGQCWLQLQHMFSFFSELRNGEQRITGLSVIYDICNNFDFFFTI